MILKWGQSLSKIVFRTGKPQRSAMAAGTFTASYKLPTGTVRLSGTDPVVHTLRDPWCLKATLENSPTGLTLSLELNADDSETATGLADRCAVQLARFLTLRWADHIDSAIVPERTGRRFVSPDGSDRTLIVEPAVITVQGHAPALQMSLPRDQVFDALTAFELHESAPPPVFAADLEAAREMYFAGMQASHPIVRFLILYSAVALLGIFKSRSGSQQMVDQLLLSEDPTIPLLPPPLPRTRRETTYTSARNVLIHAEERGKDPSSASAEVERLTPSFQSIVARILVKG